MGISSWTVDDVARWLQSEGLGDLVPAFRNASVDGALLIHLDGDMLQTLGILTAMLRTRLLELIAEARRKFVDKPDDAPNNRAKLTVRVSSLQNMFPRLPATAIADALKKAKNDMDMAVDMLLMQDVEEGFDDLEVEDEYIEVDAVLDVFNKNNETPGRTSRMISKTKDGFDDSDIFDSVAHNHDSDIYVEITPDDASFMDGRRSPRPTMTAMAMTLTPGAVGKAAVVSGTNSLEKDIRTLSGMFPHIDRPVFEETLKLNDNNVQKAIEMLLTFGEAEKRASQHGQSKSATEKSSRVSNPRLSATAGEEPGATAETQSPKKINSKQVETLWRNREDVMNSGILDLMTEKEKERQEAIREFVSSEKNYLTDLQAMFMVLLLPLEAHARSCEFKGTAPMLPREQISYFLDRAKALRDVGAGFFEALTKRLQENLRVDYLADIIIAWYPKLGEAFFNYCEMAIQLRDALEGENPTLRGMLSGTLQDSAARSLPVTAFVVAPVQRLARYPLLIKAIIKLSKGKEKEALEKSLAQMETLLTRCNSRMDEIEQYKLLIHIEPTLDYQRLAKPVELVKKKRKLLRRGPVELVTISGDKIVKSKPVEVMVFNDMFLYAKPVKVKKTGDKKYIVYQALHRSLVDVTDVKDLPMQGGAKPFVLSLKLRGSVVKTIFIRLSTKQLKEKWLESLTTPKEKDPERKDPICRVVRHHRAKKSEEISLQVGQLVVVTGQTTDGWCQGTILAGDYKPTEKKGWFPRSCVYEVRQNKARSLSVTEGKAKDKSITRQMSKC